MNCSPKTTAWKLLALVALMAPAGVQAHPEPDPDSNQYHAAPEVAAEDLRQNCWPMAGVDKVQCEGKWNANMYVFVNGGTIQGCSQGICTILCHNDCGGNNLNLAALSPTTGPVAGIGAFMGVGFGAAPYCSHSGGANPGQAGIQFYSCGSGTLGVANAISFKEDYGGEIRNVGGEWMVVIEQPCLGDWDCP